MNRALRREFKGFDRKKAKYAQRLVAKASAEGWGKWIHKDPHDSEQAIAVAAAQLQGSTGNTMPDDFYHNNLFKVMVFHKETDWGRVTHLMISHNLGETDIAWQDKQRIKDELIGEEFDAIEVFPRRSRLVDQVDAYHLWVLPQDFPIPFGLHIPGWNVGEREQMRVNIK